MHQRVLYVLAYASDQVKAKNEKQRARWGLRWEAGALSKKASGGGWGTAGIG